MVSTARAVSVAPDVVSEVVEGEAVLLDLRNGVYFSLNRVGTRIWQLIQEHGREDRVRDQLLQEFDVGAEQLERDLDHWLAELGGRGLVLRASSGDVLAGSRAGGVEFTGTTGQPTSSHMSLLSKIEAKTAHVVVLGIGYVGLPLVAEFARAGFRVTGLDPDARKVSLLNSGESYIADVPVADLAPHVKAGRLRASVDPSVLREADAVVVCVPTPLNKTKDPDMRFIVAATEQIVKHQHPDMLVVLESTTYPGTTSEVMIPKLTQQGFEIGKNVFVAFSPERVDPGNQVYKTKNTPKVIGGATPACLEAATALYSRIIDKLVPVSSTETAEMVKLLENTFRAVNIALVNEVAIMSRKLNIDPFEVIRAAATKPFGFMPFYPGPGLGGHCIPIDPLYLSWKLRALQYQARFIELADTINSGMPEYVVERVSTALNDHSKAVRGSKVLVYGVAYKKDIEDVRESPAFGVIHGLMQRGALVSYMDPFVPHLNEEGVEMKSHDSSKGFSEFDAVVIVTDHSALDRDRLLREAKLVVDTRDALRGLGGERKHVYGL